MDIISNIRRAIGDIHVEERAGTIHVSGIPAQYISKDIGRLWSTGRIEKYMFSKITRSAFSFPSFFAVEVLYLLRTMLEERTRYTNHQLLRRIISELEQNTWLRGTLNDPNPRLDFKRLNRLKRKALPHQLQFLETYNENTERFNLKGYILSVAPGGGKTFTNLLLGTCLHSDHHIIVSPKNAIYDVWKREILDWVKDSTVWMEAEGQPYNGEQFLVAHYEALPALLVAADRIVGKRVTVTLDESHNFNELTSQRTQLFCQLCDKLQAENVIWSSGTPLKALGYEIIPILRTIDPLFTPDAEERFRNIFGRNAPRGLDILKNRIGLVTFKVSKDQFKPGDAIPDTVPVRIPKSAQFTVDAVRDQMTNYINERIRFYGPQIQQWTQVYETAVAQVAQTLTTPEERQAMALYRQYIAQIRDGFNSFTMAKMAKYCNEYEEQVILPRLADKVQRDQFQKSRSIVKYLHLKVLGEALGNVLGKARINCHVEMAKVIDFRDMIERSPSKTVIFTSYVEVLRVTEQRLRALGYDPIVVYGKTNRDLTSLLERFKADPLANPILATYKSLSTAVPLISASTTIFIDQPFRDYIKHQAESRTDRLGQLHQVYFFNCLLDTGEVPNISTRSNDILEWSKAQVDALMGTDSSPIEIETVDDYYDSFESFAGLHDEIDASWFVSVEQRKSHV